MPVSATFDQETQDRILSRAIYTPIQPLDPDPPEDREPRLRAIIASVERHNKHVRENIIREARLEIAKLASRKGAVNGYGITTDADKHDGGEQDIPIGHVNGGCEKPEALPQASLDKLIQSLDAPFDPRQPEKYLWKPATTPEPSDNISHVKPEIDPHIISLLEKFDAEAKETLKNYRESLIRMLKRDERSREIAELEAIWAKERAQATSSISAPPSTESASVQLQTPSSPGSNATASTAQQAPPQRNASFQIPLVAGVKRPAPDDSKPSEDLPVHGSKRTKASDSNDATQRTTIHALPARPSQPPAKSSSETTISTSTPTTAATTTPKSTPVPTYAPTRAQSLPQQSHTPTAAIDRSRDPRLANRRPSATVSTTTATTTSAPSANYTNTADTTNAKPPPKTQSTHAALTNTSTTATNTSATATNTNPSSPTHKAPPSIHAQPGQPRPPGSAPRQPPKAQQRSH